MSITELIAYTFLYFICSIIAMGISTIILMNPSGVPYFSGNYICPNGNNCHVYSRDAVVQKIPH